MFLLTRFFVCLSGLLPGELETWNLDHSSEVDDNEWKCEKTRKKKRKGWEKDEENKKDENKKLISWWARDIKLGT